MSPRRERKPQPIPALTKPRKQRLPVDRRARAWRAGCGSSPSGGRACRWSTCGCGCPTPSAATPTWPRRLVLSRTMMLGTSSRSQGELAEALQRLGGGLRVDDGADGLSFGGESLKSELGGLLGLLAEVLTDAAYPRAASEREAGRLGDHLRRALSQPGVVADEAWLNRRYGDHPYGRSLPTPDEVAEVAPRSLRALHRRRVVPRGSLLVLVGDLTPARALDQVEKALGGWQADGTGAAVPAVPDVPHVPLLLVDRPGAVQSNLRLGGRRGAAYRRGLRRRPARQRHLRRLLLLAADPEHPRGQGLHLQPAQRGPAPPGRLAAAHVRRRRDRGDGAGDGGGALRARPDRRRCRRRRTSSSPRSSTSPAPSPSARPPRRASPRRWST